MTMSLDNFLIIPHLSKELTLIGFPELPYTLEKANDRKSKMKNYEDSLKIKFSSKLMIRALTTVCFELVKQIKTVEANDNNALDKLNFENIKLEKQLKISKSEILKKGTELSAAKEASQRLQEKINLLEKKMRDLNIKQKNLVKKNQNEENILKHAVKRKESDLLELHKIIWKQFNMVDQNYFPETFKLVQLNQPNFNQLWSKVKYSDVQTREQILKEAVCIFQNNNKALLEENFSLKTFLFHVLQEIHDTLKFMMGKMHLPDSVLFYYKNSEIFVDLEELDVSTYKNVLKNHLNVIRRVCELLDKASFTLSDDIFIVDEKMNKDVHGPLLIQGS